MSQRGRLCSAEWPPRPGQAGRQAWVYGAPSSALNQGDPGPASRGPVGKQMRSGHCLPGPVEPSGFLYPGQSRPAGRARSVCSRSAELGSGDGVSMPPWCLQTQTAPSRQTAPGEMLGLPESGRPSSPPTAPVAPYGLLPRPCPLLPLPHGQGSCENVSHIRAAQPSSAASCDFPLVAAGRPSGRPARPARYLHAAAPHLCLPSPALAVGPARLPRGPAPWPSASRRQHPDPHLAVSFLRWGLSRPLPTCPPASPSWLVAAPS